MWLPRLFHLASLTPASTASVPELVKNIPPLFNGFGGRVGELLLNRTHNGRRLLPRSHNRNPRRKIKILFAVSVPDIAAAPLFEYEIKITRHRSRQHGFVAPYYIHCLGHSLILSASKYKENQRVLLYRIPQIISLSEKVVLLV